MKKLLLNYKTLNFAMLLFLLGANSMFSQTVFEETFGTAAVAAPFTGSTSTPSVTYTQTGGSGAISTVLNNGNAYLNMITTTPVATPQVPLGARPTITGVLPTSPTGLNAVLSLNSKTVTWTVNIKTNRLGTNSTTSYAEGKYFTAVVLCASNSGILGSIPATGSDGYAIMYQKGTVDATKSSVSLIKFHNGIGNSSLTTDAQELCTATRLIESPALAVIPSTSNYAALSVKVVYNPQSLSWELFYREDPGIAIADPFVDPTTGTLTSAGTSNDTSYTGIAMTNFGFIAGVQTNNAYKFQYDNFKIVLDTPPAFTAPPTVEKRQSFNSTPTPTVANLVATSNSGGTFKWYDALTGGTLLSSSTPLTYTNYYVSQTVNGIESTRVASQVFVGDTALRTLPFYESFSNYNVNDKLILINNNGLSGTGLGAWSVNSQTSAFTANTDDALIAAQPTPTSWTSSVLPSPTGNAIIFDKSGIDPQILFNAPTTGSVYASCMFMVTNLNAITNLSASVALGTTPETYSGPGHFFSLGYSAGAGLPTAYTAAVYLKSSTVDPAKFNIGINATPADPIAANDIFWDTTDYSINTPITLVTNYSYDNYISKLWINPTSNSIEPTPNATTAARALPLTVDRVRLTQQSSATTPFITLDEIRVANNWGQALGGASTLGLVNNSVSNLTLYPNPVSNGKLFISSSSNLEKEVAIYTTLGQQVLQDKTVSEVINVSNLSQGTYFVKITEAGLTTTKKLIIK